MNPNFYQLFQSSISTIERDETTTWPISNYFPRYGLLTGVHIPENRCSAVYGPVDVIRLGIFLVVGLLEFDQPMWDDTMNRKEGLIITDKRLIKEGPRILEPTKKMPKLNVVPDIRSESGLRSDVLDQLSQRLAQIKV